MKDGTATATRQIIEETTMPSTLEEMRRRRKVVCCSGGMDPIHIGHIRYFDEAMKLGGRMIVILTRDDQLRAKDLASGKPLGKPFQSYGERKAILEWGFRGKPIPVEVVPNVDKDTTSCESLRLYKPSVFAKGGNSWDIGNLPEKRVCEELGIKVVFGVGGFDKAQSSSKLVRRIKETK